jgi:uncharacterized protein YndB with AHSA1/START domain
VTPPREITVERRIRARPAAVYALLTTAGGWSRWQGQSAEVEPVAGGRFRVTIGAGQIAEGRFLELVPESRVVFSWGWQGHPTVPPGSSTVEIVLLPDGDETVVRLTHRGLPAAEFNLHVVGWEHYVPRLAIAAEGGDPGRDPGPGPGPGPGRAPA